MNNTKTTKRALLSSVMAMLICVAMLIGTTFAWFTDSASTAVNKIQAGTLDVALEMRDDHGDWVPAEGKTLQFKVNGQIPSAGTQILWEPGCTYELPKLRVVNNGNLALKYKIQITGIQGNAKLNEAIDWTINGITLGNTFTSLAVGASSEFTIKGHMQETAGNEYQGLSINGIAITVVATQDTVEADSFGDQYDVSAEYPIAVAANIKVNADNKVAEEVTVESAQKVGTTSVAKVTIPQGAAVVANTEQLELTIDEISTPGNFVANVGTDTKTFEIDMKGLDKVNNTELFKVEVYVGTGLGTFKLYHNGTEMTKKYSLSDVREDQQYYYNSTTGVVTFLTKSFSPFTANYDKDSWSNHTAESYATPVNTTDKIVTIASAEELALFANEVNSGTTYKGYTVNLTENIALGQYVWNPIGKSQSIFEGNFDGQNHTVSNLCIIGNSEYVGLFGHTANGSVKNLIIKNANVSGNRFVGALIGSQFTSSVENCHVIGDINVVGTGGYIAALSGHTYGKITNCSVIGTEGKVNKIESKYWGSGAIAGHAYSSKIVGVTIKNMTVVSAHYGAGGVVGYIAQDGPAWLIENATVENCDVDVMIGYSFGAGYIAGCTEGEGSITNPTIINTTANTPLNPGSITGD